MNQLINNIFDKLCEPIRKEEVSAVAKLTNDAGSKGLLDSGVYFGKIYETREKALCLVALAFVDAYKQSVPAPNETIIAEAKEQVEKVVDVELARILATMRNSYVRLVNSSGLQGELVTKTEAARRSVLKAALRELDVWFGLNRNKTESADSIAGPFPPKPQKSELVYCNTCRRETNHRIVCSHRNKEFNEVVEDNGEAYASIDGYHDWEMLECQGCETVFMRSKEYFSEWCDLWDTDPTTKTYFPPRNKSARVRPNWYESFIKTKKLQGHFILIAYEQIYDLIEACKYLPAILTGRALLETLAIENCGGDSRTFQDKLLALRDKGWTAPCLVDSLSPFLCRA